jgi:hypothetical protein
MVLTIVLIFRINGFLDFAHRQVFQITRKHNFSENGSVSVYCGEADPYSIQ